MTSDISPEYLRDLFRLRDNIKNLRGVNKLQVPKPNTTRYGKNSVKYLAAITWNKISDTLRSLSTLSAFKKAVRQLRFQLILYNIYVLLNNLAFYFKQLCYVILGFILYISSWISLSFSIILFICFVVCVPRLISIFLLEV